MTFIEQIRFGTVLRNRKNITKIYLVNEVNLQLGVVEVFETFVNKYFKSQDAIPYINNLWPIYLFLI